MAVKFGAVMVVPLVLAVVLGAVVVRGQVGRAAAYSAVQARVSVAERVRDVVSGVQAERVRGVLGSSAGGRGGDRASVAASVAGLRRVVGVVGRGDPAVRVAWSAADRQLGVWGDGAGRSAFGGGIGQGAGVVAALLRVERAVLGGGGVGQSRWAGVARAVYEVDAAREEVALQQVMVLARVDQGQLVPAQVQRVRDSGTRFAAWVQDARAVGGPGVRAVYDSTVTGPAVARWVALRGQVLAEDGSLRGVDAGRWRDATAAMITRLDRVGAVVAQRVRREAGVLAGQESDRGGLAAVMVFCALLVAVAAVLVIARQVVRALRVLRRSAWEVAERELPGAVAQVQAGQVVGTEITAVGVGTREEIGGAARAFDAVHRQARRLAVEQASLRASYGEVFVNLSRRSQSLVQRQLRLIERLERDEEDPEQLATLFQLDHLATRMRRNNENLMVLSGSEPGRGASHQPIGIADLLRAAISEIEQYQRVRMHPPPGVLVVGYAAGDLVRLIAELLDNATAFSAPHTQVSTHTHTPPDGSVIIDIVDRGIGMLASDIAQTNTRLAATDTDEVPASRRLGLFVVNRLAHRHGIAVHLHTTDTTDTTDEHIGIRARVTIPTTLIAATEEPPAPIEPVEPIAPRASEPNEPEDSWQRGAAAQRRESVAVPLLPTVPEPPPATSPADGLFIPGGYGPDGNGLGIGAPGGRAGSDVKLVEETTPIFDAMLSAWFVDSTTPPPIPRPQDEPRQDEPRAEAAESNSFDIWAVGGAAPAPAEPAEPPAVGQPRWEFAADEDRHTVEAVSRSAPEEFTSAGLPRRTPKARLLPGSARNSEPPWRVSTPARDPETVRSWLGEFQRGLTEGRAGGEPGPDSGQAAVPPAWNSAPGNVAATNDLSNVDAGSARDMQWSDGEPLASEENGDDGRWRFAADDGWRAADAVSRSAPEEFTEAGLPRRTPRARLLPGSVDDSRQGSVADRDAEQVRDRLNNFQHGLTDGRHSVTGPERETYGHQWEKE